ncbi:hypothetical protein Pst134EA_019498 [Puccinia striiformis f. sp. tritici]|uniref:hypothetical protein n=1 Tax=Puccinia striiformis f. sp. tritici TaxID=168172 RepID=UPI002007463A|nr:hypothetical protein Pst134EA_019498 [Puccinia striiformis f. sp. tritici]KAH9449560.1 hypothetical protein Pst134EB_020383 [Puccinia striiformis f. sp. tritici]KAH9459346.1 hypothetical protein Pst134EA_019498 [Puccinia striiformis f. sp. tritici]KAI9610622.1 hypothetical protein H4Q26_006769 [Puccinia striiformis f. sp. tritici PST-130]
MIQTPNNHHNLFLLSYSRLLFLWTLSDQLGRQESNSRGFGEGICRQNIRSKLLQAPENLGRDADKKNLSPPSHPTFPSSPLLSITTMSQNLGFVCFPSQHTLACQLSAAFL